MKKLTLTLALIATTTLTGVVSAQNAVIQKTTTAVVTEGADQTVTHAVVTQETVQPATLIATHTVKTIMASPKDDAKVTLIGTIGAKIGKETYAFTDSTGTIAMEIDKDKLPANMAVGQQVRIDGEIDWSTFKRKLKIDADKVTLI